MKKEANTLTISVTITYNKKTSFVPTKNVFTHPNHAQYITETTPPQSRFVCYKNILSSLLKICNTNFLFWYTIITFCMQKTAQYFSKIYSSDLPHRAKAVYMYLKDRSNTDGQCYPAIGTIAKELNLSRRTVERAIQDLVKAGLIKKEQWWRENGGKCSLLYTLIDSS